MSGLQNEVQFPIEKHSSSQKGCDSQLDEKTLLPCLAAKCSCACFSCEATAVPRAGKRVPELCDSKSPPSFSPVTLSTQRHEALSTLLHHPLLLAGFLCNKLFPSTLWGFLFPPLFLSFRCSQSSHKCLVPFLCRLVLAGEKPGTEQDEVKLQNASKQIVQTAILRAVQQVSQESQQKEKQTNSSTSLQLERGKLTKKHEKK